MLFYLIGRKGRAIIAREYPKAILAQFDTSEVRTPGYTEAEQIVDALMALYDEGKFDVAHLFYSRFRSAMLQEPTEQQIVPVPAPKVEEAGAGASTEYEPEEEEILADLLPRYLRTQIFGALLENQASEQGASMTAMDNATRNAGDLINKLTIQYNRSRQAAITTELIEIIAGAEALATEKAGAEALQRIEGKERKMATAAARRPPPRPPPKRRERPPLPRPQPLLAPARSAR